MKNYSFLLPIVVIFNYLVTYALAKSDYYLISIRRDKKDIEYDKSSDEVKDAIDELVNERMNDIYDIIIKNSDAYKFEDKIESKQMMEIEKIKHLKKRQDLSSTKYKFINRIRSSRNRNKPDRMSVNGIEYVPFESDLIKHSCPVKNYYVVIAYLTDELVSEVRMLPNVIKVSKKLKLSLPYSLQKIKKRDESSAGTSADTSAKSDETESSSEYKYYDIEAIKKETGWKDVGVYEKVNNRKMLNTHLSPISQGVYENNSTAYDNNYYYPASAGKGIDIYVIDNGFNAHFTDETEEDFDTYNGERTISCDAEFVDGNVSEPKDPKKLQCKSGDTIPTYFLTSHGTMVSMMAVGKINGVAKKANLHVLAAPTLENTDLLNALDYVKQNGEPHKTIVNISIGCDPGATTEECTSKELQDKILELKDYGVIIFVAAGNESEDRCLNGNIFQGAEGVLAIGAMTSIDYNNPNSIYEMEDYSNFGNCTVLYAPGYLRSGDLYNSMMTGTSFASPIAAGVAALILSEFPEINTYDLMKEKLIELSIKDKLKKLKDGPEGPTPNRILNNGNHLVFNPGLRCNEESGPKCPEGYCCSKNGVCANTKDSYETEFCLTENGCVSELDNKNCYTKACGPENNGRHCNDGECCNAYGKCMNIINEDGYFHYCYAENGCQSEFGYCLSFDTSKITEDTPEEYKNKMYTDSCNKKVKDYKNICNLGVTLTIQIIDDTKDDAKKHKDICEEHENTNCAGYYEDPLKEIPDCAVANEEVNVEKLDSYYDSVNKAYCSKSADGNYCLSNNRMFALVSDSINNDDFSVYCHDNNCRQSVINYITNEAETLDRTQKASSFNHYYDALIEKLNEKVRFLKSSECTGVEETSEVSTIDEPTKNVESTEEAQPTSEPKPTKSTEEVKPTNEPKPTKSAEEAKPTNEPKPTKSAEESKPTNSADKDDDNSGSTGKTPTNTNNNSDENSGSSERVSKIYLTFALVLLVTSLLLI